MELSNTAVGNVKWHNLFGKQFGVPSTQTPALWSNYSTPIYLPKSGEKLCLYEDLHINVHSSFTYISKKQMSIQKWKNKQIVAYPHNRILLSNTKEWIITTRNNMDSSKNNYVEWKKEYLLYDPTYI